MSVIKRPKRPADVVGNAVRVMQIATGEREEDPPEGIAESSVKAVARGRARAAKLSPEQRSEIAKIAAQARWKRSE